MKKRAIVVFAEGFEEIEAVSPADILKRAGVEVELVGLDRHEVTGAHGITIKMGRTLKSKEDADAIVLPGGLPGAENLAASGTLATVLKEQARAGRIVAAICAAPGLALARHGILDGRRATCYPGFEKHFGSTTRYVADPVVVDGNIVTSRGPGTAGLFGLALARSLVGEAMAEQLRRGMQYA